MFSKKLFGVNWPAPNALIIALWLLMLSASAIANPGTASGTVMFQKDITEGAVATTARITIIKDVSDGTDDEDFNFNFYGYNPFELLDQFNLDDDGDNFNGLSNTKTIEVPPNRQYGFSEAGNAGWGLLGINCTSNMARVFPGISFDPNNNGQGIAVSNLQPFEEITCTFTNSEYSTIVIQKEVADGQGDPDNPDQTFTLSIEDESGAVIAESSTIKDGEAPVGLSDLFAGTYAVSETDLPGGWTLDDIFCDSRDGNSTFDLFAPGDNSLGINLAAGDRVLCVFTNSFDPAAIITIIKDVANGTDGEDFSFNFYGYDPFGLLDQFSLDDDGDNSNALTNTKVIKVPGNRTYGFSEAGKDGWNLSGLSCTSSDESRVFPGISFDPNNNGQGIAVDDVQPIEKITCTFTNQRPELIFKDSFE